MLLPMCEVAGSLKRTFILLSSSLYRNNPRFDDVVVSSDVIDDEGETRSMIDIDEILPETSKKKLRKIIKMLCLRH